MKYKIIFLLVIFTYNLSAQEYFQQESNYTIDVELDDENNILIWVD